MNLPHYLLVLVIITSAVPVLGNYPGPRKGAVGWFVDNKLWLFGGWGLAANTDEGALNDLWYFDILNSTWNFVVGDSKVNGDGVFTTTNVYASDFHPEGTQKMCGWYNDDSLWIFGGQKNNRTSFHSDIWRFDLTEQQWAIIQNTARNSDGSYVPPQVITARYEAQCVFANNKTYVYAGYGRAQGYPGYVNQLWTYDHVADTWHWESGVNDFACDSSLVQGVPSNTSTPLCYSAASAWLSPDGQLLFAGGRQFGTVYTDVTYKYDMSVSPPEWTWLPTPANLDKRFGNGFVSDGQGNAWMFGGATQIGLLDTPNRRADLLEWDGANFTVIGGSTEFDLKGNYSTLGAADPTSFPGGREGSVLWRDNSGNFWVFGGLGLDSDNTTGYLNDLWKYDYTQKLWTWVSGSNQVNQSGLYPYIPPQSTATPQSTASPTSAASPPTTVGPGTPSTTPLSDNFTSTPVVLDQTGTILVAVFVSVGVAGAGLAVLLVVLKKHKKKKQQKKDRETAENDAKRVTDTGSELSTVNPVANSNLNKSGTYAAMSSDIEYEPMPEKDVGTADAITRLIPYTAVTLEKEIGMGSFGKVYLGKLRTTKVAIKVANMYFPQEDFIREANFQLAIPPHPNIVQLLGISVDGPQPLVVLEYCNEGSLDKLLFETNKLNTADDQIALAEAIARGLDHLHQNNIVHRDLAVRNILLHHGEPKISDFGMSRKLKEATQVGKTATNIGPIRWMAPESISEQVYSTKSDVWTFGVTLYEIVARQEPHPNSDAFTVGVAIRDTGYTPDIPANCPPVLRDIMQMCWNKDPEQRPVVRVLHVDLIAAPPGTTSRSGASSLMVGFVMFVIALVL